MRVYSIFLAMTCALTTVIPFESRAETTSPEIIEVLVGGKEDIEGVENAAEQYPHYREPNVVVTKSGRVVVVAQGRHECAWGDRSGQDLVCKWSKDNGATWSKGQRIATHGLKSICPSAAVYDAEKNRIHVLYNLFTWDYTRWDYKTHPEIVLSLQDCLQYVVTSDDEGETWTAPRDISSMIDTNGSVAVFGSGEGIQLSHGDHRGRLIIAGGLYREGERVLCYVSDDHGETWRRTKPVPWQGQPTWASETRIAELPDGVLVLNSRTTYKVDVSRRNRTRSFSKDGGLTWSTLESDPGLKTEHCNGSLLSVERPEGESGAILLFSAPAGPQRIRGTVFVSFDGGKTWPRKKMVVPKAFAYSSLVRLADGGIGLFYESMWHRNITFTRFTLEWLLDTNKGSMQGKER